MYEITRDDSGRPGVSEPVFVTFGEVMIRDTPADRERPERTRLVHLSAAGSEFSLAVGLSRMGVPSVFVTRVPDNPYGRLVRNTAREQGVNTDYFVWAPKAEPIGRFIYETGRTPRKNSGTYQRMHSAASKLGPKMVDWEAALRHAVLFHTSGITFGLASHSGYETNLNRGAFIEAHAAKPAGCKVGLDLNYRGTLWEEGVARDTLTPIIGGYVDILITTIEDIAQLYGIGVGKYSAREIVDGDMDRIEDDDLIRFAEKVVEMFEIELVALTVRYPDSFERHRWESAVMHRGGSFSRSPQVKAISLLDRLGGGDAWNAGFYYGLITEDFVPDSLGKAILIGDAVTRLKQTLMFDLPIVTKREVEEILRADMIGGGKRTER